MTAPTQLQLPTDRLYIPPHLRVDTSVTVTDTDKRRDKPAPGAAATIQHIRENEAKRGRR